MDVTLIKPEYEEKAISAEDISKVINDIGTEAAFDIFHDYVKDIATLCESMQDLYKQNALILTALGVHVTVSVNTLAGSVFNGEFGFITGGNNNVEQD